MLAKRGKLTAEEFDLMKSHTTVGAAMLADSAFQLVTMAEEIALTHHEKWDGGGYPAGLSKEAIPITGRIVAVADVFDALTHVRPYKPAWSADDAIAEMQRQSARHFDPQVLDAFLSTRRMRAPRSRAPDPVDSPVGPFVSGTWNRHAPPPSARPTSSRSSAARSTSGSRPPTRPARPT